MALTYSLYHILDPHVFAHHTRVTFRGLTISKTPEGYRAILRAFDRQGLAVYAMAEEATSQGALEKLYDALGYGNAAQIWNKDKYYSKGGA